MGGPIWAKPIHDQDFVKGMLDKMESEKERYAAFQRIKGLLTCVLEELPDVPLYYRWVTR
jgi:tRNA G26 N,N-dimethylase Trm1